MVTGPCPAPVLWLTGLSGAGKSTIAACVNAELRSRGTDTEYLDGDVVRSIAPGGFGRTERDAHIRRVGFFASRFADHGVTVICALISPYAESRAYVRGLCGGFVEIYLSTSQEYNLLPTIPLLPLRYVLGASRLAFELNAALLFVVPFALA